MEQFANEIGLFKLRRVDTNNKLAVMEKKFLHALFILIG